MVTTTDTAPMLRTYNGKIIQPKMLLSMTYLPIATHLITNVIIPYLKVK